MTNNVDQDQTARCLLILNSSVMLGNYLQQTTSADDIFRCIFGALRLNMGYHKKTALLSVYD